MPRPSRAISATVVALAIVMAGCAARGPAYDHPAAATVEEILELRADDVRDADAYARYFLDSAIATALAEPSDVPTGTPRVPDWEPPYVSEAASGTADVVVVWKPSDDFPDWPAANIFVMQLVGDDWLVVDAEETSQAPAPLGE